MFSQVYIRSCIVGSSTSPSEEPWSKHAYIHISLQLHWTLQWHIRSHEYEFVFYFSDLGCLYQLEIAIFFQIIMLIILIRSACRILIASFCEQIFLCYQLINYATHNTPKLRCHWSASVYDNINKIDECLTSFFCVSRFVCIFGSIP